MTRLAAIWPEIAAWPPEVREQIEIDAAYAGYLDRQDAGRRPPSAATKPCVLPADLDYAAVGGLSNEAREKLAAVAARRPSARPPASKASPPARSQPCSPMSADPAPLEAPRRRA